MNFKLIFHMAPGSQKFPGKMLRLKFSAETTEKAIEFADAMCQQETWENVPMKIDSAGLYQIKAFGFWEKLIWEISRPGKEEDPEL